MSGNEHFPCDTFNEEHLSLNYKTFSLDKEEPFSFTFHPQDILLEPEEALFLPQSSEPPFQVKMEAEENNYIQFPKKVESASQNLHEELQRVRNLMDTFRMLQQVILATSKQGIYQYGIGFDSQPQQDSEKEELNKEGEAVKTGQNQESNQLYSALFQQGQQSIKIQNNALKNTMFQAEPEHEFSQLQQNKEHAILITVPNTVFNRPSQFVPKIDIIRSCFTHAITQHQKKKFLILFEKLQALKKGITLKMAEMKGVQHNCKICDMNFETGRKLGGHMSRKHPGNSFEYQIKKQVHSTKICERNRRNYFKVQKRKCIVK